MGSRSRKNRRWRASTEEEPTGETQASPVVSPEGLGAWPISQVSDLSPSAIGVFPLDVETGLSTPLDADVPTGETIPLAVLWAMKARKHHHRPLEPEEPGYVHAVLGDGDAALYFVDDGGEHCMIGRLVGHTSDGLEYCLVARIPTHDYQDLRNGDTPVTQAFSDARDICLCSVFKDERTSDVVVVQHYGHAAEIPAEYLPPSPSIEFTDT